MPAKKVEEVEDVVVPEIEMREGANGSKYKFVGNCAICGKKLWKCTTAPNFDMGIEMEETAVFVAGARNSGANAESLATYCKKHNPVAHMKRGGVKPGEPLPGDTWKPLR